MDKRLRRLSRRSLVAVVVGLAFGGAAGVGLAQITSEPSTTRATTQSTGTLSHTTSTKNDFDFEQEGSNDQTSSTTGSTGDESDGQAAGQQKIEVCHVTGNGGSHTIDIAEPALAAHRGHGDTDGACAQKSTPVSTSTTTVTVKTKKPRHSQPTHVPHSSSKHTSHGKSRHSSDGHAGSAHGNGHGK
jgi:hypothetical protein